MPYPTKYTRQYDFQSYQVSNPTRPLPGNQVNVDLNAVKQSLAETIDFLKTSIRADGRLANGSVGVNQLDATFNLGFSLPTMWEPGVDYTTDSTVLYDNKFYIANVAHTSTDGFDESKWDLIVDFGEQATAAAASASAALASQNAASSSASTATTQAGNASTSATAASNSATAASGSATTASTQATNASNSATAASGSAAAAAASFDSFDDRYLGAKAADPTLDNDGDGLLTGALYWSTTESALKVYDGADWQLFSPTAGDMLKSNNLSDVANATTALANLGGLSARGSQTFTSSGTFTTPANSKTSTVYHYRIQAGGGGGGSNGAAAGAGGGGNGAYAEGTFTGVAPSTGITVTVGTAGAAGASSGTAGTAGTTSLIGSPVSISCSGGAGALGSTSAVTAGGAGGTVTGSPNIVSIAGRVGSPGVAAAASIAGGDGSSSMFGNGGIGGRVGASAAALSAATGYGAGGGGGTGATGAGSAGTAGIVIIDWVL